MNTCGTPNQSRPAASSTVPVALCLDGSALLADACGYGRRTFASCEDLIDLKAAREALREARGNIGLE